MAEVHRYKVVSSLEPRPLRPNVVTDFEWTMQSLREKAAQAELIGGVCWFRSPKFDVHGTEHAISKQIKVTRCVNTELVVRRYPDGALQFILEYVPNYRVSVVATLRCGDYEETRAFGETNGCLVNGETMLFQLAANSPTCREVEKRDGFSIRVRLTTVSAKGEQVNTHLKVEEKILPQSLTLASDLKCALKSGELSDVTLKSEDGDVFPAHRQLLALRSPVFRAMFYGQMREASSGNATIKASSASVQQLLQCIYTDEVDKKVVGAIGLELYELGIQYELTQIVDVVRKELFNSLSVDNAVERFLFAMRHSINELAEACESIIKGNLAAVMKTNGWTQITANPSVMGILLNGKSKHRDDDYGASPRKLKRLRRSGM